MTTFVNVVNAQIVQVGGMPRSGRRLDNGAWVLGLRDADEATRQACGWFELVETPRPTPEEGNTVDKTIELVDGIPTVTWTERAKTDAELDADAQDTKEQQQLDRLQTNFQELRQTPPALDNAQLRDEVRLLRSMVLDLTRIVRGMAAE